MMLQSTPMHRRSQLLCIIIAITILTFLSPTHGFQPRHHTMVPHNGVCVPAPLSPTDFCTPDIIDYPISSMLLHQHRHVISPRHDPSHTKILSEFDVSVLSKKAQIEYGLFMKHHQEKTHPFGVVDEDIPEETIDAHVDTASGALFSSTSHTRCSTLLRKYLCQLQFPRCFNDIRYTPTEAPSEPIQLHVCYSLCHEVRDVCQLHHRINCASHHSLLNPDFLPPSEHELQFNPRYSKTLGGEDPFKQFWRIDCIDSPPSAVKYIYHYLLDEGPLTYLIYACATLVMYAILARLMAIRSDAKTRAAIAQLRVTREQKRREFQVRIESMKRKYEKLQHVKEILVQQREKAQQTLDVLSVNKELNSSPSSSVTSPTHSSSSLQRTPKPSGTQQVHQLRHSIRSSTLKLTKVDTYLNRLTEDIQAEWNRMKAILVKEEKENEATGFSEEEMESLMMTRSNIAATEGFESSTDEDDAEEDETHYRRGRGIRSAAGSPLSRKTRRRIDEQDAIVSESDESPAEFSEEDAEEMKSSTTQRRR